MSPRIYVADLAAYVAGYLHGAWIDLDGMDLDDLNERVQAILAEGTRLYGRETLSQHEEFAIHDYEGFGSIPIGEYTPLETIVSHVERMGDEPNKYFAWIESRGISDADNFDPDMVHGPYESESDYFDQFLDGVYGSMDLEEVLIHAGVDKRIAESLASMMEWIDAETFVRDLQSVSLVELPTGEYSREYWEVDQC